jgi:D-alanyl-lipoteichoic acid acyltransferase DltB (MBOAT superfamily)
MLFNSLDFGVFLVLGWLVYRLLERRAPWQLLWLLSISAFFYGCWKPWYLVLVAVSTLLSYVVGILLDRTDDERRRKALLIVGVVGDLLLLATFKYGNFAVSNVNELLSLAGAGAKLPALPTELPVGISFYTFHTLAYTIDVYKRRIPRAKNLLHYGIYVLFFPQLVAGPIVRPHHLLPQLENRPRLDRKAIGEGTFLILAGLFKKMVIADTLASFVVQPFFDAPRGRSAVETLFALWSANFQVYCDFSGYSDVALGAALLFGFSLPINFDRPFVSRSPMEHWRRWHISLSTWLRDYLYFPLGGSKKGAARTDANLIVTFLLGGLWHGAGWTFLVWGLYNGVLLALWRRFAPAPRTTRLGKALEILATFHAICFGLVFLHAESFGDAGAVLASLGNFAQSVRVPISRVGFAMLVFAVALHATPPRWKSELREAFAVAPAWALAGAVVIVGGILSLFAGMASPFFYFQF